MLKWTNLALLFQHVKMDKPTKGMNSKL